jgi:predicted Zn finger-like uncharacterized protein
VRVQCPGCRSEFTVPDDKIPESRGVRILCPKCKAPIEIKEKQSARESAPYTSSPASSTTFADSFSEFSNAIDVVEEGVKTALLCVCNAKRAEKLAQSLHELDFWVVHAARAGFALGKLHHNNYDLTILEENFDSAGIAENLVLHHMQLLPMHLRRQSFLCLLSETLPTLDTTLAFRLGVNLTMNLQDIEKAKLILARSLKEFKNFYTFFNAELNRKIG